MPFNVMSDVSTASEPSVQVKTAESKACPFENVMLTVASLQNADLKLLRSKMSGIAPGALVGSVH